MKIKSLHIKNFKSIVDLTINEPNPFTVFVGPNGSGKSNIFEALELSFLYQNVTLEYLYSIYEDNIFNKNLAEKVFELDLREDNTKYLSISFRGLEDKYWFSGGSGTYTSRNLERIEDFYKDRFSRIFVSNKIKERISFKSNNKLSFSCDNLAKVLKRLLENQEKREKISEWLELFLPEFDRIEVQKRDSNKDEYLLIYQKHYKESFNNDLISDGTYNIIALLTAVYQSDEPQFLCIEEPENGLNPYVIRKLVDFFRNACAEKGHYIWLNTHSQTLVECLQPEEVIVVDKINGETQIKQIKGMNLHGLDMAEVWLSGALGGGTPW